MHNDPAMNEFHQDRISTDVDWLLAKLVPLKDGKPVMLQLINEAGIGRKKNPLITIVPVECFGFRMKSVVVSVIGCGSCIVHVNENRLSDLVMAGIPTKYAKILITKLQLIFNDEVSKNGNSTSTPPSGKKPRAKRNTYTKHTHRRASK